jgi:oligogalacturonide transport system permease protein
MRRRIRGVAVYVLLIAFGIVMCYPLLYMVSASFRTNQDILTSMSLIPTKIVLGAFVNGWVGAGQYTFGTFFVNTFLLVVPTVVFTIVSSTFVAYGFARFHFRFRGMLFLIMISTLMLPNAVVIIPRYILFREFHWLDSYLPFVVPAAFAVNPFFNFAMIQFFRGIPRDLDESAIIDGCGTFRILAQIMVPLSKAAMFAVGILQFIWTWNDFFNVLVYVNSVRKFTVALGLRMSMGMTNAIQWNQIMAMSLLTMIPCILIFFFAQRSFVEGIAVTGIKG